MACNLGVVVHNNVIMEDRDYVFFTLLTPKKGKKPNHKKTTFKLTQTQKEGSMKIQPHQQPAPYFMMKMV